MNTLRRYAEVYAIMLRNSLIREMSFKANFLLWMFVEALWFLGQIVFIEVIFSYVETIGDWTKWEVILLVGTHQLIAQIFQAFFFVNLSHLPELVRTGKLDFLLALPIDDQFAVSTKQFGLDSLANAALGAGIVIFSLGKLGITPTPTQILIYLAAVMMGVVIHYCVMLVCAGISFWTVRSQGLFSGYFSMFTIGRYPDVVFRGVFRFIFSWVLPVIIVANIPTRVLAKASDFPLHGVLQLTIVTLFIAVVTRLFWKFAVAHYSSASS